MIQLPVRWESGGERSGRRVCSTGGQRETGQETGDIAFHSMRMGYELPRGTNFPNTPVRSMSFGMRPALDSTNTKMAKMAKMA